MEGPVERPVRGMASGFAAATHWLMLVACLGAQRPGQRGASPRIIWMTWWPRGGGPGASQLWLMLGRARSASRTRLGYCRRPSARVGGRTPATERPMWAWEDPPLVAVFRGLDVEQQVGRAWPCAPSGFGGAPSWHTAGFPEALFGFGQGVWPRAALSHARRQGLKHVMRSASSAAAEAFGCFATGRWRHVVGRRSPCGNSCSGLLRWAGTRGASSALLAGPRRGVWLVAAVRAALLAAELAPAGGADGAASRLPPAVLEACGVVAAGGFRAAGTPDFDAT